MKYFSARHRLLIWPASSSKDLGSWWVILQDIYAQCQHFSASADSGDLQATWQTLRVRHSALAPQTGSHILSPTSHAGTCMFGGGSSKCRPSPDQSEVTKASATCTSCFRKWICRFMSWRLLRQSSFKLVAGTEKRFLLSSIKAVIGRIRKWKSESNFQTRLHQFSTFFFLGSSGWLGKTGKIATNVHDISAFWITEKSEELGLRGLKPGLRRHNYFRL